MRNSAFNRNRTDARSRRLRSIYRGHHNITARRRLPQAGVQRFLPAESARNIHLHRRGHARHVGDAAISGSDLADFLLGIPDTSSIAFGNADKYFREPVYDAYATDDWRVQSELTINAGVRWEYGAPMTELYGRLVNLDIDARLHRCRAGAWQRSGWTAHRRALSQTRSSARTSAASSRASASRGVPFPRSTMVVRAGYGIYSRHFGLPGARAADGAAGAALDEPERRRTAPPARSRWPTDSTPCSSITADTFAVDPNFRVGYAQNWQLSVQRDLPGALQMTATYLGIKGTRGVQEFLPNTYPIGAVNPCPACPSGFVYRTSGGNSTREAGQMQLRRRLRNGFTATLQYTYSKSIDDDAALGGQGHVTASPQSQEPSIGAAARPTRHRAELARPARRARALHLRSAHLLNLQAQYTTGKGLGGGTLMSGWRGRLLKEWTVLTHDHDRHRTAGDAESISLLFPAPASRAPFVPASPARHSTSQRGDCI